MPEPVPSETTHTHLHLTKHSIPKNIVLMTPGQTGQGPEHIRNNLTTIFLMLSLGKWTNQKADKERFLTLMSSGQLLEQRPLSTVEDRDARVRHVTQHVLHVQHSNTLCCGGVSSVKVLYLKGHCINMYQTSSGQIYTKK